MVAGIGLYGMLADGEPRAEVYASATKKDQAMILFRDAVAAVDQSGPLTARLKKSGKGDKVWNLYDEQTASFFRPISADDGQSGPRPHIGLVDELHEHKDATVLNMLIKGQKFRRQPLVVAITNSGTDLHSICYEKRTHAIGVSQPEGDPRHRKDDTFFGYVCALDPSDDPWRDKSCWVKVNPTLGTILTEDYLQKIVAAAENQPSLRAATERLNFCIWNQAFNPALDPKLWMAAGEAYELSKFRGMRCVAGIDLSATTDLTAIVLVFEFDGLFYFWPMFWIPEEGLEERDKKDKVPYSQWVKEGHVYTTPGAAIDKDFVVHKVAEVLGRYDITIEKAPFDRHRIDVLKAACDRQGLTWPLEPHGQGFLGMGPSWDIFETMFVEKKARHPNNPCFTACAAHAVIQQDPAGNKKLDKAKSTGRIDGIVAATMAAGVAKKANIGSSSFGMEWV